MYYYYILVFSALITLFSFFSQVFTRFCILDDFEWSGENHVFSAIDLFVSILHVAIEWTLVDSVWESVTHKFGYQYARVYPGVCLALNIIGLAVLTYLLWLLVLSTNKNAVSLVRVFTLFLFLAIPTVLLVNAALVLFTFTTKILGLSNFVITALDTLFLWLLFFLGQYLFVYDQVSKLQSKVLSKL